MTIKGYGVVLKRIELTDLELIRKWRNNDRIRNKMYYKKYITKVQQLRWFNAINNEKNNYFIIENDNTSIGLINGGAIDWEKNITGNGGIFIWATNLKDDLIALKASILLTDCGFFLDLNTNYIKVLKSNTDAILYNQMLGYKIDVSFEHEQLLQFYLTQENYFNSTAIIRNKILKSNEIEIIVSQPFNCSTKTIIHRMKNVKNFSNTQIKLTIL